MNNSITAQIESFVYAISDSAYIIKLSEDKNEISEISDGNGKTIYFKVAGYRGNVGLLCGHLYLAFNAECKYIYIRPCVDTTENKNGHRIVRNLFDVATNKADLDKQVAETNAWIKEYMQRLHDRMIDAVYYEHLAKHYPQIAKDVEAAKQLFCEGDINWNRLARLENMDVDADHVRNEINGAAAFDDVVVDGAYVTFNIGNQKIYIRYRLRENYITSQDVADRFIAAVRKLGKNYSVNVEFADFDDCTPRYRTTTFGSHNFFETINKVLVKVPAIMGG